MSIYGDYPVATWGAVVGPVDIDWAIIGKLQMWLPTYIDQIQRDYGLPNALPRPKRYDDYMDPSEFTDGIMPAVFVLTAQTTKVVGGANDIWQASWRTEVCVVVRGRSPRETKALASRYETAVRRCMLQKVRTNIQAPADGVPTRYLPLPAGQTDGVPTEQDSQLYEANASILSGCEWQGMRIEPVKNGTGDGRWLSAGCSTYTVLTDKAASSIGGPNVPNAAPYNEEAQVTVVTTDVEAQTND